MFPIVSLCLGFNVVKAWQQCLWSSACVVPAAIEFKFFVLIMDYGNFENEAGKIMQVILSTKNIR